MRNICNNMMYGEILECVKWDGNESFILLQ